MFIRRLVKFSTFPKPSQSPTPPLTTTKIIRQLFFINTKSTQLFCGPPFTPFTSFSSSSSSSRPFPSSPWDGVPSPSQNVFIYWQWDHVKVPPGYTFSDTIQGIRAVLILKGVSDPILTIIIYHCGDKENETLKSFRQARQFKDVGIDSVTVVPVENKGNKAVNNRMIDAVKSSNLVKKGNQKFMFFFSDVDGNIFKSMLDTLKDNKNSVILGRSGETTIHVDLLLQGNFVVECRKDVFEKVKAEVAKLLEKKKKPLEWEWEEEEEEAKALEKEEARKAKVQTKTKGKKKTKTKGKK